MEQVCTHITSGKQIPGFEAKPCASLPEPRPEWNLSSDSNAKRQKACLLAQCLYKNQALELFFKFERKSLCGCTGSRMLFSKRAHTLRPREG